MNEKTGEGRDRGEKREESNRESERVSQTKSEDGFFKVSDDFLTAGTAANFLIERAESVDVHGEERQTLSEPGIQSLRERGNKKTKEGRVRK
jgi:hypothetical protein